MAVRTADRRRGLERRFKLAFGDVDKIARATGFSGPMVSKHLTGTRYNRDLEVYLAGWLREPIMLKDAPEEPRAIVVALDADDPPPHA